VPMPRNCTGVDAASRFFYGKAPAELTIAEAASLAASACAPNRYDPERHPEDNIARRNIVLSQMLRYGYISDEEYSIALNEPLNTVSHTVTWQNKMIRNLLLVSSHKNLMLSGRSFHISPKSVRGRIMAYLNSVSLKNHNKIFDIPFDRQQMADYLNLDRTALSKELGRMKKEGIIDFHKNHFKIV